MPFPTDRGYAALRTKPDGTTTVMISTDVKAGKVVNVFAKHVGVEPDRVKLGPGVRLVEGSSYSYTEQIVEVFGSDGALHIRLPDSRFGLSTS